MSGEVTPPSHSSSPQEPPRTRRRYFTFHHVNSVVIMVLLSAAGMVPAADFGFVLLSVIYMYFLSKVAFPRISSHTPPVFENRTILNYYVTFAAVIAIFLPMAYIIEGIFEGDKEGNMAAAPHLFLLASQVLMEGVSYWGNFSLPIRVFVPVFYNSRRIFTILEWLRSETSYGVSEKRLYAGKALAVANMVLWSYNLFGFLLPVYLPRSFKIYYSSNKTKD